MHFLKTSLSSAASSHVSSNPRRSSRMVSGQFFLSLPLPLFPPGAQFITCLALLSLFILVIWPNHVSSSLSSSDAAQFLLPRSFSDCLVWYFIPPWDTQDPPQPSVMRRLCSLLLFATVIGHVSDLYRSLLSTMVSCSRTLVSTLQPLFFHILSILPNTALALPVYVIWFPCRNYCFFVIFVMLTITKMY